MHLPLFLMAPLWEHEDILMQQMQDLQRIPQEPKVSVNELTQVLMEGEESWTPTRVLGPPNGGENYGKSLNFREI